MRNMRHFIYILFIISICKSQNPCTTYNRQKGFCMKISECSELQQILRALRVDQSRSDYIDIIKKSFCGFINSVPQVCCKQSSSFSSSASSALGGSVIFPNSGAHNNAQRRNVLPSKDLCGQAKWHVFSDRIVDGEDAPLGSWPWIVQMIGKTSAGRWTQFCGGTLISDRYVISAAHCFLSANPVQLSYLRIGDNHLKTTNDCEVGLRVRRCAPPHQDIVPEKIINHPEYRQHCRDCNDIALIRLIEIAKLNDYVSPICLPFNPEQDMGFSEAQFQGKTAEAAGWGSIIGSPDVRKTPSKLQRVNLRIQELDFCSRNKRKYSNPRSIFCAGGGGKDTCRGDSGGPLTLSNNFLTRYFLVGITSTGSNTCGLANTQGIYTNVIAYKDWILKTIQS